MSKYDRLQRFLRQSATDELILSFDQVEQILDDKLPASAFQHRAWWSNSETHVEATAWLKAGWKVEDLDQQRKWVKFRRTRPSWCKKIRSRTKQIVIY